MEDDYSYVNFLLNRNVGWAFPMKFKEWLGEAVYWVLFVPFVFVVFYVILSPITIPMTIFYHLLKWQRFRKHFYDSEEVDNGSSKFVGFRWKPYYEPTRSYRFNK